MNDYWCIPSKEDADFVACMEDVLDVYELPYDPMYLIATFESSVFRKGDNITFSLPQTSSDSGCPGHS